MRILVAGANGQVGQSLVNLGPNYGFDMIGLRRDKLDITSMESVVRVFSETKPGLVINAAAYTAVDKAESEVKASFAVNELGPQNLAQVCAKFNIPLFHISTDYVFDGTSSSPYTEDDPVAPLGVYARSKEAGERCVRNALAQHIILRTSWVFSKEGACFPKTILKAAKKHKLLKVVNDQVGGPTSAVSIANMLLHIAKIYLDHSGNNNEPLEEMFWGTYHFSQMPYVSWYQFAQEIIFLGKRAGLIDDDCKVVPCASSEYPVTVTRPENSRLDIRKISSKFQLPESKWQCDLEVLVDSFTWVDTE